MKLSGKAGALVFSGLLLVVGMASASVLDSFGVVSGEADVEGPTFWAAPGGQLWVNERSDTDGNYELDGANLEREFFTNYEIDGGSWYPVQLDYYVDAKIRDESDDDSGNLALSLRYDNGDGYESICTQEVLVDSGSYETYSANCSGSISGQPSKFQYEIEATNENADYRVQAYDVTRVEVSAQ